MTNSTAQVTALPPTASQEVLDAVSARVGFVPNLFSTLARQPGAVEAFAALDDAFSNSSLTPIERQTVLLAASVENKGRYCVAGHTLFGRSIGMPESVIQAIRSGNTVGDERLEALHRFVRRMIQVRGHASQEEIAKLLDAGFAREQILDVIMGITLKAFSNYSDSSLGINLDETFEAAAWSGAEEASS